MMDFDAIRKAAATTTNNDDTTENHDDDTTEKIEVESNSENYWGNVDPKRLSYKMLGALGLLTESGTKADRDGPLARLHTALVKTCKDAAAADREHGLRAYREARGTPTDWTPAYVFEAGSDELVDTFLNLAGIELEAYNSVDWQADEDPIYVPEEFVDVLVEAIEAQFAAPAVDPADVDPKHVAAILATIRENTAGVGDKTYENIVDRLTEAGFDC
jgi:hypothetical protein